MEKRTWRYAMPPAAYNVRCDKCGGSSLQWSEWAKMVWCRDCNIDTPGTPGLFGGSIALGVAQMLGLSLDRIDLVTGARTTPVMVDGHIVYVTVETKGAQGDLLP